MSEEWSRNSASNGRSDGPSDHRRCKLASNSGFPADKFRAKSGPRQRSWIKFCSAEWYLSQSNNIPTSRSSASRHRASTCACEEEYCTPVNMPTRRFETLIAYLISSSESSTGLLSSSSPLPVFSASQFHACNVPSSSWPTLTYSDLSRSARSGASRNASETGSVCKMLRTALPVSRSHWATVGSMLPLLPWCMAAVCAPSSRLTGRAREGHSTISSSRPMGNHTFPSSPRGSFSLYSGSCDT
mmetsp:Transcript_9204/g.25744  ORF Transcript_9204/g.25744 Transcript_9204/m.25744 type:complete len:243 (-) Transcript_9204:1095-1823(-)